MRHQLGDSIDYDPETNRYTENFNGHHSPILGWVSDGYPVYGPYGYTDPNDPTSEVRRMISGFRKRNITQRQTLPANAARDQNRSETLPANLYGPNVSAAFPVGHYLEDYEYLGDLGFTQGVDFDLNEHNVRFCVTPEFPEGTYAYFVCIEEDGTPAFPYNIGRTYFGNSVGGVTNTIPANAVVHFEGGPEMALEAKTTVIDDEVTITWSALEGGTYFTEASSDLETWQATPSSQSGNELAVTSPASRQFFRATLLVVEPFDDAGFDYTPLVEAEPNNILLVIVDDWGIDFSALDNPTGPNLPDMPTWASLASQGIRFTNAYAQPMCSPTRAGILSGRYSFRHGIGSPAGANFPATEVSLPEAFANANSPYALGSFGKWHLGGGDNGPSDVGGWAEFRGSLGSGVGNYFNWDKTINGTTTPVTDTYATSDQVDDAVTFINAQGDEPWFCWLAFNAPHAPFHNPPTDLATTNGNSNTARYLAALEAMDRELARLLESVDLSKTNVFLIGENGTPGNIAQVPFTQGKAKGTLYEGGIRVPFIALGPDVRTRGTRDDLVQCTDLFATILDLANVPLPETELDSRSLMPALLGGEPIAGGVVLEIFGNGEEDPGRTIRIGDYKLHLYDDGREEFYNVVSDLPEENDLLLGTLDQEQQAAYDLLLARQTELLPDTGLTDATGVLSATPSSAAAGSTVTLTITLDPNQTDPEVPGVTRPIDTVTLGPVTGTNINRLDRYNFEATFTLPNTPGSYPVEVIFTGPQRRTFGLNDAFEVQ